MLLGFDYLYKFIMFFSKKKKKQKGKDFKNVSCPKFCNIIFLFLLEIG